METQLTKKQKRLVNYLSKVLDSIDSELSTDPDNYTLNSDLQAAVENVIAIFQEKRDQAAMKELEDMFGESMEQVDRIISDLHNPVHGSAMSGKTVDLSKKPLTINTIRLTGFGDDESV